MPGGSREKHGLVHGLVHVHVHGTFTYTGTGAFGDTGAFTVTVTFAREQMLSSAARAAKAGAPP